MSVHLVKKWIIKIYWDDDNHPLVFRIFDDHYANALSKLREFSFEVDPKRVEITGE